MGYATVSYSPAVSKGQFGIAVLQVDGCAKTTSVDVPYGVTQGTAAWSAVIDPEVAKVIQNMDPNSDSYDPSLLG